MAVPPTNPEVKIAVDPVPDIVPSPVALHDPPEEVSVSEIERPAHSVLVPCIGVGLALIVSIAVAEQTAVVYDTVVVPVRLALAVTTPVALPTVASRLLMLHVPPVPTSLNEVVAP